MRVDDVAWEDYEQLMYDLRDNNSVRVYYDHGRMEIMSPLRKHEAPVGIIARSSGSSLTDSVMFARKSMPAAWSVS